MYSIWSLDARTRSGSGSFLVSRSAFPSRTAFPLLSRDRAASPWNVMEPACEAVCTLTAFPLGCKLTFMPSQIATYGTAIRERAGLTWGGPAL